MTVKSSVNEVREPGVPRPLTLIHTETGAAYPLKVPKGKYRVEVNGKPALISIEGLLLLVVP